MSDNLTYYGTQDPGSGETETSAADYLTEQVLNRRTHATLVKVVAVTGGGLAAVGRVDVVALVNQTDGRGRATPHETAFGLCYFRAQGGRNAIICDPQVGDVGLAVVADRDVSAVKATGAAANPGSGRRGNLADGVFFGLCLGATPEQYLYFTENGIEIADKNGNKMVMSSTGIAFTSAKLTNTGDVIANGVSLHDHLHGGVERGGARTDPPDGGAS